MPKLTRFVRIACLALLLPACNSCGGVEPTGPDAPGADGGTDAPTPPVTPAQLAEVLPKGPGGEPVLAEVDGTALTIGPERQDAVAAAAKCTDLVSLCVVQTKDLDACVDRAGECATAEPWKETAACCARACKEAYREERRLGAPPIAAHAAVFGSTHECFPGLQDQYRAAGGVPYLAPRRAP
jgi:hypothetical protein